MDDEPDTWENLCDILEMDGYAVEIAGSLGETLECSDWADLFAVLLDRQLPDGTAEDLLPRIRRFAPDAAVVIITGYCDLAGVTAAIREGAADYILKPIEPGLIRSRLAGLAERRQVAREIVRINHDRRNRVAELQALFDVIPIGIAEDPECRPIRTNPALARLLRIAAGPRASFTLTGAERPDFRILRDGRELSDEEMPLQLVARGTEVKEAELEVVVAQSESIHLVSADDKGNTSGFMSLDHQMLLLGREFADVEESVPVKRWLGIAATVFRPGVGRLRFFTISVAESACPGSW
ncbi:MAG: response regulator [Gemmataceae bacterium]